MSLSGAGARRKGSKVEREIAAYFGGKRVPLSGGIPGTADVELPPPFDGLHVEVKARAKVPELPRKALEQAAASKRAIGNLRYPCAIVKEDRGRAMVFMWLDDWKSFTEALYEAGQGPRLRAHLRQLKGVIRDMEAIL